MERLPSFIKYIGWGGAEKDHLLPPSAGAYGRESIIWKPIVFCRHFLFQNETPQTIQNPRKKFIIFKNVPPHKNWWHNLHLETSFWAPLGSPVLHHLWVASSRLTGLKNPGERWHTEFNLNIAFFILFTYLLSGRLVQLFG